MYNQFQDNSWDFKDHEVPKCKDEKCPEMKDVEKVVLSQQANRQIDTLLELYPDQEWIAGLKGEKREDHWYVDSLFLAEQTNTRSTTEFTTKGDEDLAKEPNIIGWIHSHNTMSVFQSCTDEKTASQHNVSITVNNKKDFFCTIKKKLSCGREFLIETDVELLILKEIDEETKLKAQEVIKTRDYTLTYHTKDEEDFRCAFCFGKFDTNEKVKRCPECQAPMHKRCRKENSICIECESEYGSEYYKNPRDDYRGYTGYGY